MLLADDAFYLLRLLKNSHLTDFATAGGKGGWIVKGEKDTVPRTGGGGGKAG